MDGQTARQAEYQDGLRAWARRTPVWRRALARLGLQGKLVISIMALLAVALGTSSWLFVRQSSAQVEAMIGEQARSLAWALSLGSGPALAGRDQTALRRMAQPLVKGRNVLFIAFLDQAAHPVVFAGRDPSQDLRDLAGTAGPVQAPLTVRRAESRTMGRYLVVVAPVIASPVDGQTRLTIGSVAVGMSSAGEQAVLTRTTLFVLAIGLLVGAAALPLACLLVHRIFQPIRQLVQATHWIAAGDMHRRVAIDRPDLIGVLARAFNEMVLRIRRQQEDLADANRDLEQKVRQRTAQLEAANRRLSGEIAEKEDFLRAVSHDLNAPLRNISGMATMLLLKHKQTLDQDVIHRLERIQKNVEAETDLIGELLELSRIKTRRQKMAPVEVGAMIHELLEVFEPDLKAGGISVVIDGPLPVLNCERSRLRRVFQNLIDNAIKYMGDTPAKPRRINIGCRLRVSEAEFYVSDTGVGIDPEDIGKVFYVFRRGKNRLARRVPGKGIGLASVKSIVETYNGSIWVQSQVGQGSTFHFTINGVHVMGPHWNGSAAPTVTAARTAAATPA